MTLLDLGCGRLVPVELLDVFEEHAFTRVRATMRGFVEVTVPRAASILTTRGWLCFEVESVEHRREDAFFDPACPQSQTYTTTVRGSCRSRRRSTQGRMPPS